MLSQSNEGCGWAGPLPEFKEKGVCQACQKLCSAGEVLRCQMKGKPIPKPTTQHVVKPARIADTAKSTKSVRPPAYFSGIGDRFKTRMSSMGIKQKSGCPCKDVQSDLNRSTPEEVKENMQMFIDKIFGNVKNVGGLMGPAAKLYSYISPDSAKTRIREILLECLEDPAKMADAPQTL